MPLNYINHLYIILKFSDFKIFGNIHLDNKDFFERYVTLSLTFS